MGIFLAGWKKALLSAADATSGSSLCRVCGQVAFLYEHKSKPFLHVLAYWSTELCSPMCV